MIPVELTEQQALAFRLLSMAQAWDIKAGSITLHFDSQGVPVQAETRTIVYAHLSTGTLPAKTGHTVKVVI